MPPINVSKEGQRQREEEEMKKSFQLLALDIPYAKLRQIRFTRNDKDSK